MTLKFDIVIIFSVMVELYRYAVYPQTHYQRSKIQCCINSAEKIRCWE